MLIKCGAIVTDGRGSVGGHTMSKNTYGAYMRTKVTPVNRSTTAQQAVRQSLTAIAQLWRTLSDAQRSAWDSLAREVSRTNIFGDSVSLTSFNLFLRLNRELNNIGVASISNAPNIPTVSSLTSLTLTAKVAAGLVSLAYLPTPVPASHEMVIDFTPQVSQGISFVKSEYRKLAVSDAAAASPYVGTSDYATRFGAPILNKRIFARAKFVEKTTGFSSLWLQCSTIVIAS